MLPQMFQLMNVLLATAVERSFGHNES